MVSDHGMDEEKRLIETAVKLAFMSCGLMSPGGVE